MNFVFDFGAVLFTWDPAQLVSKGFPHLASTPEKASQLASAIFHHADWQAFDCGLLEMSTVIARTASRLALPPGAVQRLIAPIGEQLAPIAGSVELLAQLCDRRQRRDQHGDTKLYFLSNMSTPFARALERRCDFLQWFDGGIFSGDVKLGKPDPAIYRLLAARYGLQAADTLFIDDMLANVQAAEALGWQTLHCQQPDRLSEQLFKQIMPLALV